MDVRSYEELMRQAIAASVANDAESAILLWTEACAVAPVSAAPHLLLGAEFAQLGRINEAEAAFANAVMLSPELLIARFQLGLLQFTSGRVDVALLTWQPILDANRAGALRMFVRGFAALARDEFASALSSFEAGVACDVGNAPLNADILMVMQRTRELVAQASPSGMRNVTTEVGIDSSDLSGEHVLLANYQQHGLPH